MPVDLKVWPIKGKFLCFNVESRSKPQFPREVDMEDFKFNGSCNCEKFDYACHSLLSKGANPADHLRCAHIKAARSYFLDEILPKIFPIIRPLVENQINLVQQAEGIVSAIVTADETKYDLRSKLQDLMMLKAHVDAAVEQIHEEIDSARDPEKHEDHPAEAGHPDDMQH